MAEALARKILSENPEGADKLTVSSAGVAAWPGAPATKEAVAALAGLGVDLSAHRATRLTPEIISKSDLILTMTRAHREHVRSIQPQAAGKVFTIAEYAGFEEDVPDPIGSSVEVYRLCAKKLESLIFCVLERFWKQ